MVQPGKIAPRTGNLLCAITSVSPFQGLRRLVPPGRNFTTKEFDNYRSKKNVSCQWTVKGWGENYPPFSRASAFVIFSDPKSFFTLSSWVFSLSRSACFLNFCFSFHSRFCKRAEGQASLFVVDRKFGSNSHSPLQSLRHLHHQGCWGKSDSNPNLHPGRSDSLNPRALFG